MEDRALPSRGARLRGFLLGTVVVLWLARSNHWAKYRKTERNALGIVLGLAMLLGFIGFMILTQQEPYNCCAGG